ncbi:MAG: tetratricopeptide repeat protein [Rubripirellula sp.]
MSLTHSVMVANDRAGVHMSWAMICEQLGHYNDALAAYETSLRIEPNITGARTNLAALLEGLSQNQPPERAQAMQQRAAALRQEELPLLARDAQLAADNAGVQYRYGLALYLSGNLTEAKSQLEKAVALAPN